MFAFPWKRATKFRKRQTNRNNEAGYLVKFEYQVNLDFFFFLV